MYLRIFNEDTIPNNTNLIEINDQLDSIIKTTEYHLASAAKLVEEIKRIKNIIQKIQSAKNS